MSVAKATYQSDEPVLISGTSVGSNVINKPVEVYLIHNNVRDTLNTVTDALTYYTIVKEVLGKKWLTNQWLRLGTSSLANKLLSEIDGKEVKFF